MTMYVLLEYNGYSNPHIYDAYKQHGGYSDQIFRGCFNSYEEGREAQMALYEQTKARDVENEYGYELKFNEDESGECKGSMVACFSDEDDDEEWFVFKLVCVTVGETYDVGDFD